jgi:hypothetical protein
MSLFGDQPLDGPPFCIIQQGKQKSRDLADAVIAGYGGGAIGYCTPATDVHPEYTPVIIGVHPTTSDTLHDLKRMKRAFVTIDNGYLKGYKEGGYFRATSNALQWITGRPNSGAGRAADDGEGARRYAALDLPALAPWRTEDNGGHVLLVLQSPAWLQMMREEPSWLADLMDRLRKHTDREVIIRHKPLKNAPPQPPLEEHLDNCYAVVGYSSMAMLKAAMAGIPVFPTAYCAVSPLQAGVIESIMRPKFPERESIMHNLAANQWTLEEIAGGRMWTDLQTRYQPEFLNLS